MTTNHTGLPTNVEFYSPPEHSHVFRDLRHRATFTQPSSRQPVTTTTTRSTALKDARDALTHPSHDAVALRVHDEPPLTHHSVSATPTRTIQRLQIDELFQQPSHWDTELLKSTRDAGPSGLLQHPGVEEQKARPRQRDTETPLGSRDADPLGSQRPWIDDCNVQFYNGDTVALQGTRDADLLGSRHPRIDDRTLARHSMTRIPECHKVFEKPAQQVHDACGFRICYDEALRKSLCTGITLQPAGQKESKMPQTDIKHCYGLKRNELQNRLAKPEINAGKVTSFIPVNALPNPPDVKGLRLPRSKPPAHPESKSPWTDTEGYHRHRLDELLYRQTQPGNSADDAISCPPANALSTPLEVECPELPKLRPVVLYDRADSFKAHRPHPSVLRSYAFTCTPHDDKGKHSSTSDPTSQEIQNPTKSTNTLQDQDQALVNTLRMLFKASEEEPALITSITEAKDGASIKRYEFAPEYAELLARAMHLITDSLNDYWKAAETTKTFSFGWSSNYNMEFPQLIYRRWATRLVLDSVKDRLLARILLAMEAVEECFSGTRYVSNTPRSITKDQVRTQDRTPQAEDLRWELQLQRDRSAILPNIAAATVRALSSEQSRRLEDRDYTYHLNVARKEQTIKIPLLIRTSETTTTWELYSYNYRDNAPALAKGLFIQQSPVTKPDTRFTMWHRPQDQTTPYVEDTSPRTPSERNGHDVSPIMHPNHSWRSARLPDQDRNDRVRLPPNDSSDSRTGREISPQGPISHLQRGSLPFFGSQHSPYHDEQERERERERELHSAGLTLRDSIDRKINEPKELQRTIDWSNPGSKQGTSGIQKTETETSRPQAPSNSRATLNEMVTSGHLKAPNYGEGRVPDSTTKAPFCSVVTSSYLATKTFGSYGSSDSAQRNLTHLQDSRTTKFAHQDWNARKCPGAVARQTQEKGSAIPDGAGDRVPRIRSNTPKLNTCSQVRTQSQEISQGNPQPIQLPLADEQREMLQSPQDRDKTSFSDSVTDARARSQGDESIGSMDSYLTSAATTPPPILMQRYYPGEPCYRTAQLSSIPYTAMPSPFVGPINLFIRVQPHLQADREIGAISVLSKPQHAQVTRTRINPRMESNESQWSNALSDSPVERKGTVCTRPVDDLLKEKALRQRTRSMLVLNSRTQRMAPSTSQTLSLSWDGYHANDLTLPARHPGTTISFTNKDTTFMYSRRSTKGPKEQFGSSRELEWKDVRSLLGLQSTHDWKNHLKSSEACKGRAKCIPEREYRYHYSSNWPGTKLSKRTSIYGLKSDVTTGLTDLLNELRRKGARGSPITYKFTYWRCTLTRRNKRKTDFLVILFQISRYKHKSQASLVQERWSYNQRRFPTTRNLHSRINDYSKLNRGIEPATNQKCKTRSKRHKASSEYPAINIYIGEAPSQGLGHYHNCLRNDPRNDYWYKRNKTASYNRPANAVNINREEIRIATPRGEDEGSGAHGDSYTLLSKLATNVEKDRAPRLNTGLSEKNSTTLLEDHLSIPDTQTPANQAIQGVDPYKTLRDANDFKKVIEFTISALGTTNIWDRRTNHKWCCRSLCRNTFEVEKNQRRENLEFKAELDDSISVTKDLTPLTTSSCAIMPATEGLRPLCSDEATRKPETSNLEANLINSPLRPLERITVKSRLTPQPQEVLDKRLEVIQITISTSIQGTDSILFARYDGGKATGRTLEKPNELSLALNSSKKTILSRIFEGTTRRIKLASKTPAKSRNTRLKRCPSPVHVDKLWNEMSEGRLSNHQRNFKTARKLESWRDRKMPEFTLGLAACHTTRTPYNARKAELFAYGLQTTRSFSVVTPLKGCREHEQKYRHHRNALNYSAARASLLLWYGTIRDPRRAQAQEKLPDLLENGRTRKETPSRRAKEFQTQALSAVKTQYPAVHGRATTVKEAPISFQSLSERIREPKALNLVVIALPVLAVKHKIDLESTFHHCRRRRNNHSNWPPVTISTPHLMPRLIRTSRMMMPCPYHHLKQLLDEELSSRMHSIEKEEVLLSSLHSLKLCKKLENYEKQAERHETNQFWNNDLRQPTSAGETTAYFAVKGYGSGKESASLTSYIWARSLNPMAIHKTRRVANYRHTHDQRQRTKLYLGVSPARHPSQNPGVTLMIKAVLAFRRAKLVGYPLKPPYRRTRHYEPPRSNTRNALAPLFGTSLALLTPNYTRDDEPRKDQLLASPWSKYQENPSLPKEQPTVCNFAREDEAQVFQRATLSSAESLHFLTTLRSSLKFTIKTLGLDCRSEWVAKLESSQFTSLNFNHSTDQTVFLGRINNIVNTIRKLFRMGLEYTIPELRKLAPGYCQIARLKLSHSLNLSRIPKLNNKDSITSRASRSTCLGYVNGSALPKEEIEQRPQSRPLKLRDLAKNGKVQITSRKRGSPGSQMRWKSLNSKDKIWILTHGSKITPDLESRKKFLSRVTLTRDRRLFNISTPLSKISSTMSQYSHEHYRAIVTVDPTASSPAPIDQGSQKGYFDDEATRSLLSLDSSDRILHSGTYGEKELSTHPIAFATLRAPRFDQRLLPFTPRNHAFTSSAIDMHEQNGQFPALVQTRKNLEEHLNRALLDAQIAGNKASISLPNYALILVPRLKYSENGDGRPFPYQFLVFFSPSATRMRGVRIGRIMAILDATTNCAHAMVNGPGNWPKGEPVGIVVEELELNDEDLQLLATFRSLGISITGNLPENFESISVPLDVARDVLIGKAQGKTAPITNIPNSSADLDLLSGTDYDALYYAAIDPNHDANGLEADGLAKTRNMRRDDADNAFIEGLQDGHEDKGDEPAPPYLPAEVEVRSTGQSPRLPAPSEEPVGYSGAAPPTITIPLITESQPSSSTPDVSTWRPRKSTVAAQRSRNYTGPYTQPIPAAAITPLQSSRRPPSRHGYAPTLHNSPRLTPTSLHQPRRRSPSPNYRRIRRRSPSPPIAASSIYRGRRSPETANVRIIQTHEQQRIVQDTDTGISAIVPIMQVSSIQMGLDLSALMQPAYSNPSRGPTGFQTHLPRSREDMRESSRSRHQQRTRSPHHNYTRRRSASPSPSPSHSPPLRQSHARHYGPPSGRNSIRINPNQARVHNPVPQDPSHCWGETEVPSWGSLNRDDSPTPGAGPSSTT